MQQKSNPDVKPHICVEFVKKIENKLEGFLHTDYYYLLSDTEYCIDEIKDIDIMIYKSFGEPSDIALHYVTDIEILNKWFVLIDKQKALQEQQGNKLQESRDAQDILKEKEKECYYKKDKKEKLVKCKERDMAALRPQQLDNEYFSMGREIDLLDGEIIRFQILELSNICESEVYRGNGRDNDKFTITGEGFILYSDAERICNEIKYG